jgi:hypothetical protein
VGRPGPCRGRRNPGERTRAGVVAPQRFRPVVHGGRVRGVGGNPETGPGERHRGEPGQRPGCVAGGGPAGSALCQLITGSRPSAGPSTRVGTAPTRIRGRAAVCRSRPDVTVRQAARTSLRSGHRGSACGRSGARRCCRCRC